MPTHRLRSIASLMLMMAILMPETEHTRSETLFPYNHKGQADGQTEAQRYCGEQLPVKLHDTCSGVYNSRFKKSNKEMEVDDYDYDSYPYKSAEEAKRMFRSRRGIYDECCLKPCYIDELRSYCGETR